MRLQARKSLSLVRALQSKLRSGEGPAEKEGGDRELRTPSGPSVPGFGAGENALSVLPWGAPWEPPEWVQGAGWEADPTRCLAGGNRDQYKNGRCCTVSHLALDLECRCALGATLSMLVSAGSLWVDVQFPAHPGPE